MNVREAFALQSKACLELGSPFMGQLMALLGERLAPGHPVADRILTWEGDVSPYGQSVPLRTAGALHALVLDGDPALRAVYPPNSATDGALWEAVLDAFSRHSARILDFMQSPPQTNEVRRSAAISPAMHAVSARYARPMTLVEVGCSGGLNLFADQFCVHAAGTVLGPEGSMAQMSPDWTGPAPRVHTPEITQRIGIDINPIDATQPSGAERLLAYLWPDQPDRIERTRAAIDLARHHPSQVVTADAAAWLETGLDALAPQGIVFLFHTIAWQYLPKDRQAVGDAHIARVGATRPSDAPLVRFAMEADGGVGAALTLTVWPGGTKIPLGRADFHGRWVEWCTSDVFALGCDV